MKTSSCKRFTLIEMLVVIAIISILAGLVFPALGLARQNAKKSKANSECQSLKTAIIMYESEFSCWPVKPTKEGKALDDGDYKKLCDMLTGGNAKKMTFYEAGLGYDENEGMILDPWGIPYQVILDTDFDGKIENKEDAQEISKTTKSAKQEKLSARVIVFSYGGKFKNSSDAHKNLSKLSANKQIVVVM